MPRKNGFQFRMAQMNDRRLAQIPAAAYSSAPWLKERAESLGVEFFHKPLDNEALLAVYWKDGTKSDIGG